MTAGKYHAMGFPYALSNPSTGMFFECVHDELGQYRYTRHSWGYPASPDDMLLSWDSGVQQWRPINVRLFVPPYVHWWSQEGDFESETMYIGYGYFILPTGTVNWTASMLGQNCP